MDIKDIKTIEQAKALAFDAIQRIEIEQNNLRALQQRIVQLEQELQQEGHTVMDSDVVEPDAKKNK